MTLFCHGRCHLTITDTTCNDNRMQLDQPQKAIHLLILCLRRIILLDNKDI
ncbi:hypothetical protein Tsp_09123 [Trichinella spiralis]|uniref:hypothetical protein n=1 Tax=Trichinella spiralis TaxID=6334 RepID=UPI0001EFCB6D|nr:hypothetical protein Tsp_09123 [Trichinella spiralis]